MANYQKDLEDVMDHLKHIYEMLDLQIEVNRSQERDNAELKKRIESLEKSNAMLKYRVLLLEA